MSIEYTGWTPTGGRYQHSNPNDPNNYNARRNANTEAWAEGIGTFSKPIRQDPKQYAVTKVNEETGKLETQSLPGLSLFDDLGGAIAARHNEATVVDTVVE